jgi:hypothetical protein
MMFGGRGTSKFNPSEYRAHVRKSARGLRAFVDGVEVELLDYSEGGLRVRYDRPLPRVATIEMLRNEKPMRTIAAVVAWSRNDQTGYAFRPNQKLAMIETKVPLRRDVAPPVSNERGGVSGAALRDRLKL